MTRDKDRHSATKRERYERLRAAGICVQCGHRPAYRTERARAVRCAECRRTHHAVMRRARGTTETSP